MTKFILSTSLWLSCLTSAFAQINEPLGDPGVRPQAEDGRVLNLDFETGDLTGVNRVIRHPERKKSLRQDA